MIAALDLLQKYNVPVPRYTSYPTVPYWKEGMATSDWNAAWLRCFSEVNAREGIALYLHLPFCESLCTYCGCNKRITTNHNVEEEYISALLAEWALYRLQMPDAPVVRSLHLGGGTPTFFSAQRLEYLLDKLLDGCELHPQHEFSVEAHPLNTTVAHLRVLYNKGFRRLSLGVQDNDPLVQRIINRMQPFETVELVTQQARDIGYTSVNYDLIYGLPLQTLDSMAHTVLDCISLRPDRVAFYSYAHVPWTAKGQRLFDESDLPPAELKLELYHLGKQLFLENGYEDVGMDHFALPDDELCMAKIEGRLHRNFMGYTVSDSPLLLGLGVSAISGSNDAFAQNDKTLEGYYRSVRENILPIRKGYLLDHRDLSCKKYILDIACKGRTRLLGADLDWLKEYTLPELRGLEADGLVTLQGNVLTVTHIGKQFIRNVCSAFDMKLQAQRREGGGTRPMNARAV
ncbi:oxygen-independent coproporphyrinogen III oxidase [Chitinophaga costaii]|nr:oxygen-independent coproporphyrinogen III oxidase [Chitinophaga costaii]